MKQLYILDGANFIFRSYFAIKNMTNKKGVSTNALFGFIRSIQKLRKDFNPDHLICVFDGPDNKKSRTDQYEAYKAHRKSMPDDLFPQLDLAELYCKYAGIPQIEVSGVEADDTIGSIALWAAENGFQVFICSGDKDLCQLVRENIYVLNTFKENLLIDASEVMKIYGVRPDQIVDYLAICGDASDNIPGIKSFGPKTAIELLSKFGSLASILERPELLENKKKEERLKEERENALLSQKLATIQIDVPFPKEEEFFTLKAPDKAKLKELYEEMDFKTLLKELEGPALEEQVATEPRNYHLIDNEKSLEELLAKLSKHAELVIDTETTSIEPMRAKIVGIGLTGKEGEGAYIPFNGTLSEEVIVSHLTPFLSDPKRSFIGHNIKYDMHVLANHGLKLGKVGFDTMIASYLLNSNEHRHNLDLLVEEHFAFKKIPIDSLLEGKKSGITMDTVPLEKVMEYCCEDVDYTMRLKNLFEKGLKEKKLWKLFTEVEMLLLPVLYKMERHGMYVDLPFLQSLSVEFTAKIDLLRREICALAGKEFNLNSPKQLSQILFEDLKIKKGGKKTESGYSTNASVLASLIDEHPIIPLILNYRTLEKLRSTYIDALPECIHPKTHRIHTSFTQSGTATGRLASNNPNLQNIPIKTREGKRIREAFCPEKTNWSYISADYSQIELRILAHFSEDPTLVRAFENEEDIHKATASEIFSIPLAEVTNEMRSKAKAVNFGVLYGQQAFGLSQGLGIDIKDASRFIEAYFKKHPRIKEYVEHCKKIATLEGKATSLLGRERLIPELKDPNSFARAQGLRYAVNSPIQGTQADIVKLAMIELDKKFYQAKYQGFMILQIHDELLFESPDEEIASSKEVITKVMENIVKLKVPLRVDISVGKNWGEC